MAQYADVVAIFAATKAMQGEKVDVQAQIKNLYTSEMGILVMGSLDYGVTPWPAITFPSNNKNVPGGATISFPGYFTMPNYDVKIHIYSYWYGGDGQWHFDDEMTFDVDLSEVSYGLSIGVPAVSAA